MNVKMTTGPLAVRSASLTCLPPGAARVKSGAFCPTSSAATGEARARPVSSRATTGARIPRRMGGLLSRVRVDADRTLGGLPKFPARAHNARMPTVLAPEAVVAEGISRQAICISWRIHRERVLLAGWGRAILLQLAHPMVAQGVAEHSAFTTERWGWVRRLHRTLDAMLALTFGSPDDAAGAAARINAIHDRVHGRLDHAAGGRAPATAYSAHDPALLAWVHATLLDSFLGAYRLFVGPLSPAEADRYCLEASGIE